MVAFTIGFFTDKLQKKALPDWQGLKYKKTGYSSLKQIKD